MATCASRQNAARRRALVCASRHGLTIFCKLYKKGFQVCGKNFTILRLILSTAKCWTEFAEFAQSDFAAYLRARATLHPSKFLQPRCGHHRPSPVFHPPRGACRSSPYIASISASRTGEWRRRGESRPKTFTASTANTAPLCVRSTRPNAASSESARNAVAREQQPILAASLSRTVMWSGFYGWSVFLSGLFSTRKGTFRVWREGRKGKNNEKVQ